MLCTKCGKNHATTHYKSVINGQVHEEYLCPKCAENLNISSFYFPNVFSSLLGENANIFPFIGITLRGNNDIKRSGKAGCSNCYETFKDEILPTLNQIHGTTKHKISEDFVKSEKPSVEIKNPIEAKKGELKKAVLEERFEDAARLRDEIKQMEGEN